MKFLHTSDLQLGRPFSRVKDAANRESLREARLAVLPTLGRIARENACTAILVAGDLFDSTSPDKATVAKAMAAIRALAPLSFYVIPGNHDNAGIGNFWDQDFFQTEVEKTPTFHLLATAAPLVLPDAVLLPCPLFRQQDTVDPCEWLHSAELAASLPADRPWIVLAHGSVHGFESEDPSDEDDSATASKYIDIASLNTSLQPDYIALGDWHGQKCIAPNAYYSGTPEPDRFPKNESYENGLALLVDVPARGAPPTITPIQTGALRWITQSYLLTDTDSITSFEKETDALHSGCLKLSLSGNLSFSDQAHLNILLDHLESRLLRLKLDSSIQLRPSPEEIEKLKTSQEDNLIPSVATRLYEQSQSSDPQIASTATEALHILFGIVTSSAPL